MFMSTRNISSKSVSNFMSRAYHTYTHIQRNRRTNKLERSHYFILPVRGRPNRQMFADIPVLNSARFIRLRRRKLIGSHWAVRIHRSEMPRQAPLTSVDTTSCRGFVGTFPLDPPQCPNCQFIVPICLSATAIGDISRLCRSYYTGRVTGPPGRLCLGPNMVWVAACLSVALLMQLLLDALADSGGFTISPLKCRFLSFSTL